MFDGRAEGILARRWRSRSQRVVFSVSTSFAREVDGDGRPSGGIFGVIGPGFSSGFVCNIRRFQRNWRIPGAIHAFRAFQANAHADDGSPGQREYPAGTREAIASGAW